MTFNDLPTTPADDADWSATLERVARDPAYGEFSLDKSNDLELKVAQLRREIENLKKLATPRVGAASRRRQQARAAGRSSSDASRGKNVL